MSDKFIEDVIRPIIDDLIAKVKARMDPEYAAKVPDETILGIIVSKFVKWDANSIGEVAASALCDSNCPESADRVLAAII